MKNMKRKFQTLIPELSKWNNGKGIDVHAWIQNIGSYEQAIGYLELFRPSFIEVEGCIFREDSFNAKRFRTTLDHCQGDKTRAESIINSLAIYDLHTGWVGGNPRPEPTLEQVLYLGRGLAESWQDKLKRDFPKLKVIARFNEEEISEVAHWAAAQKLEEFAVTAFRVR